MNIIKNLNIINSYFTSLILIYAFIDSSSLSIKGAAFDCLRISSPLKKINIYATYSKYIFSNRFAF